MTIHRMGLLVALLGGAASSAAEAQRTETPASQSGWRPRTVRIGSATASERAAMITRLEAIERILLRVPALAHPHALAALLEPPPA